MTVKLLAEHHLEFLSLSGGCKDSSEHSFLSVFSCQNATLSLPNRLFSADNFAICNQTLMVFLNVLVKNHTTTKRDTNCKSKIIRFFLYRLRFFSESLSTVFSNVGAFFLGSTSVLFKGTAQCRPWDSNPILV